MGFSDLEYGWSQEAFILRDVKVIRHFQLEQQNKSGEWEEREPSDLMTLFADTDEEKQKRFSEYEKHGELRYAASRFITAKAFISGRLQEMFLGIPENKEKQKIEEEVESRIDYFDITIQEEDASEPRRSIGVGFFGYHGGNEEFDLEEAPYASFFVTSQVFEEIERMANIPEIEFDIRINRKGWSWTGRIGDGRVYLHTTPLHHEPAELNSIVAAKRFRSHAPKDLEDSALIEDEDFSQNAIEANIHLYKKLSALNSSLMSLKSASWLATLALIYIAYRLT